MTDPTPDPQDLWAEAPWNGPSTWYKYRCPSCEFTTWIEDIVIDAFPPERPGGLPLISGCIECGNDILRPDSSVPPKKAFQQPHEPK